MSSKSSQKSAFAGSMLVAIRNIRPRATILTLKKIPVVIYGKSYWKKLINFDFMVEQGTISEKDLDLIHFSDDPQEAFEYLKDRLTEYHLE